MTHLGRSFVVLAVSFISFGCAGSRATAPSTPAELNPQTLPIFDGRTGHAITWDAFIAQLADAEIVILGERHDDAVGHYTQQAIVEALTERWENPVLAMEMLERDEQLLVDDYRDGVLDEKRFATETSSTNWGGKDQWGAWYHPMIDTVLDANGRVVAANAPRRYVRFARTDGYDRLLQLDEDRRAYFDLPIDTDHPDYRRRFDEIMGVSHDDDPLGSERLDDTFRSQLVWDATMATSVADAFHDGGRVVHLVGQFHSDFRGGLVLELERRAPSARLQVVTMRPSDGAALLDDDRDRADFVVYTASP